MYKEKFGNIANKDKVNLYLIEKNIGDYKWAKRSKIIAETGKSIAIEIGLDPDVVYSSLALVNIGKLYEKNQISAVIKAFEILREESYFFQERIALSTNFVLKDIKAYEKMINTSKRERNIIENFLKSVNYNDYDYLSQLLYHTIDIKFVGIDKMLEKKYGANPYKNQIKEKLEDIEKYFEKRLKYKIESYVFKEKDKK